MKNYRFGRKISLEKRTEMINWYLEGYSAPVIAKHYGIDHSTVFHYLKEVPDLKERRKPKKPDGTPLGKECPDNWRFQNKKVVPKPIAKPEKEEPEKFIPKKTKTYADYIKEAKLRELK